MKHGPHFPPPRQPFSFPRHLPQDDFHVLWWLFFCEMYALYFSLLGLNSIAHFMYIFQLAFYYLEDCLSEGKKRNERNETVVYWIWLSCLERIRFCRPLLVVWIQVHYNFRFGRLDLFWMYEKQLLSRLVLCPNWKCSWASSWWRILQPLKRNDVLNWRSWQQNESILFSWKIIKIQFGTTSFSNNLFSFHTLKP